MKKKIRKPKCPRCGRRKWRNSILCYRCFNAVIAAKYTGLKEVEK